MVEVIALPKSYVVHLTYKDRHLKYRTSNPILSGFFSLHEYIDILRKAAKVTYEDVAKVTTYNEDSFKRHILDESQPLTQSELRYLTKAFPIPKNVIKLADDNIRPIHAKRMMELRHKMGWSQDEIAKRLNITRTTYAGYETGRNEPDIKTLVKLAEEYKVPTDFILGIINYNRPT